MCTIMLFCIGMSMSISKHGSYRPFTPTRVQLAVKPYYTSKLPKGKGEKRI